MTTNVQIEQALAPVAHEGHQMIDARGLHEWLGPKMRFNDWIRERIASYSFDPSKDFYCFSSKTGGRPKTDYFLTINMAKELAMVERSQIGQLTRRYFIEMEQAAKDAVQSLEDIGRPDLIPQSHADAMSTRDTQMFMMMQQMVEQQNKLIEHIVNVKGTNVVPLRPANNPTLPEQTHYFARDVVSSLRLAGQRPTQSQFTSKTSQVARWLCEIAAEKNIVIHKRLHGMHSYNAYPYEVVQEFIRRHA